MRGTPGHGIFSMRTPAFFSRRGSDCAGHQVDALRLPALERGHAGARLGDELPHDGVELGGTAPVAPRRLARVGGVADHRRVVLGDVVLDHEGAGADRARVHLVARLADGLRRHHREHAGGGRVQEGRVRRLEGDLHRVLVENLRSRVAGEGRARPARLELRVDDAVEVELHRLRVERRCRRGTSRRGGA